MFTKKQTAMVIQRRHFISNLSQVTTLVCAGSLLAACSKSSGSPSGSNGGSNHPLITVDLATQLTAIGDSVKQGTVIVVRDADGDEASAFVALSLVCTHLGCTVDYNKASDEFLCPCHGSKYNGKGEVLLGPAAAPLEKLKVTVTGNVLTVT
jgi:cytochrome b6-f complex iron-sulfur subunit